MSMVTVSGVVLCDRMRLNIQHAIDYGVVCVVPSKGRFSLYDGGL
ncbi:hypothetical protein [Candidatus Anaplasma sp. TIGMIC]|nr:hypothetical protein [Candidatus Anaplasma sp. TIGMIC]MDB1135412.1 hypothetical protein [Candidatus Anaplasma sp. TIGMIC]